MILTMVGPSVRISFPWKPSGQAMGGSSLNGGSEGKERGRSAWKERGGEREEGKEEELGLLRAREEGNGRRKRREQVNEPSKRKRRVRSNEEKRNEPYPEPLTAQLHRSKQRNVCGPVLERGERSRTVKESERSKAEGKTRERVSELNEARMEEWRCRMEVEGAYVETLVEENLDAREGEGREGKEGKREEGREGRSVASSWGSRTKGRGRRKGGDSHSRERSRFHPKLMGQTICTKRNRKRSARRSLQLPPSHSPPYPSPSQSSDSLPCTPTRTVVLPARANCSSLVISSIVGTSKIHPFLSTMVSSELTRSP